MSRSRMLDRNMFAEHILPMVEVLGTDEFGDWFRALADADKDSVARVIDMLEQQGVALPYPYSSAIQGTRIALRELRVQSQGHPLRVFYAFDPARQAVLLIGGDKTGDNRFYDRMVPLAERIWAQYLEETGQ